MSREKEEEVNTYRWLMLQYQESLAWIRSDNVPAAQSDDKNALASYERFTALVEAIIKSEYIQTRLPSDPLQAMIQERLLRERLLTIK